MKEEYVTYVILIMPLSWVSLARKLACLIAGFELLSFGTK